MTEKAATPVSLRFSLRLTTWLALGWVAAITLVWLFRFDDTWLWPSQLLQLVAATAPSLRVGPYFVEFWTARFLDLVFIGALFAAAFAIGAIVVELLTEEKGMLAGLFAMAIGLWVVAVLVMIIGAFSVARTGWVLSVLLAWLAPAPRRYIQRVRLGKLDGWSKLLLAFAILAGVLNLLGAVAPPFEYDELVYHLGAPAEYIKAGRILALPHNFYSDLPQLTEMLYLLAMVVRSDIAAKLLHWSFGILAATATYAVAARFWTRRTAMTAAAFFYCLPFVQDLSQTARIDLATTFFSVLAMGGLLVTGASDGYLWLSALAAGGAVATKWPAVAVVLLPAIVYVLVVRRGVLAAAGYGLVACCCVVPWAVKNWLCTGNPAYPLLNGIFGSPHWSAAQSALFAAKHAPRFDADGLKQFFGLVVQYSFNEPGAIPLLLLTVPLVLLRREVGRPLRRVIGLFSVAYLGWYLLTFRPWRFLFPVFPLAAMAGADALDSLRSPRFMKVWLHAAVGTVMVFGLVRMMMTDLIDVEDYRRDAPRMNLVEYSLGQLSREEFVARMGNGVFDAVVWMNHTLPPGAKVLFLGEARAYYSHAPTIWATAFDQHPLTKLLGELRAGGISYVYVNHYELDRLRRNYQYLKQLDWTQINDLLDHHARVVYQRGPYVVYALED
jgi:4-amino-4-deoxy-L-arabinose transferase-like glycosyltransferase